MNAGPGSVVRCQWSVAGAERWRVARSNLRIADCGLWIRALLVAWLCLGVALPASAQLLDRAVLVRKQEDQERARAMTRALLDGVLQLQLRQLEENGLTDLPVYRDIGLMRTHLQEIVDQEMPKVVELLAAAQSAAPDQREETFIAARQMIRTVVVRLSTERQSLLRRLKAAELAEQTQRLIGLQSDTQTKTRDLREQAQPRQAELLLRTQEDQRDIREFFLHLVDTLDDVRTWGGPLSETAVDGLRLLKAADVGRHLDQAETELATPNATAAMSHQSGVLSGLQDLLKLLQKNRGMLSAERTAAVEKLRGIAEKQAEVRAESKQLEADSPAPAELVDQQVKLQQELAEVAAMLSDLPVAERLAEQAEVAAKAAAEDLFETRNAEAVSKQGDVLTSLSALEDLLTRGGRETAADQSATDLAEKVAQLQETQEKLEQLRDQQTAAMDQAQTDTAAAKATEQAVADQLKALAETLPAAEETAVAVNAAQEKAQAAATALPETAAAADSEQMARLQAAEQALDRALATVAAELDDTERRAAAVKIGELARAAEVLERAAAEEREISRELQAAKAAAASDDELSKEAATEMLESAARRQADVAKVAEKIAEGLSDIAPSASEQVDSARQQAGESQAAAEQARQSSGVEQAEAMQKARDAADATANTLAQAAKQLRDDIAAAAKNLAQRSEQRANDLAAARDQVEDTMSGETLSLSEAMAQLQQARQLTDEAAAAQQRAEGRPEAAAAMELARGIEAAQDAQEQAAQAAKQFERGDVATPLKATTAQQSVAEMAAGLQEQLKAAQQAAGENSPTAQKGEALQAALAAAEAAAGEAAKQTLNNQPAAAAKSREQAQAALSQAAAEAAELVAEARQAEPTAPANAAAQKQAAETAQRGAELAQAAAPTAGEALSQAALAGTQAAQAIEATDRPATAKAQDRVDTALTAAERELDKALQGLAEQQARALAAQARQAAELTTPTAMLDIPAATALEAAEAAAMQGAASEASPTGQMQAARSAQQQLERAAASLAAREQEVRRDQAVAAALADLAMKQQAAAATLDAQRAAMAAAEAADAPAIDPLQAARAAEQFAEAQTATGQGAVELSGQQQVANSALREALEMAGELLAAQMAAAMAEAMQQAMSAPADAPATPAQSGQPPGDAVANSDQPAPDGAAGSTPSANGAGEQATSSMQAPSDTGFVPQNPQLTAQMMAGAQLNEAMQQAAAGNPQQTGQAQTAATSPNGQPLETNSAAQPSQPATQNQGSNMQAARQTGGESENQGLKDGPMQDQPEGTELADTKGGSREGDADVNARQFQEQPWFAKLPPELRKSIRAGTQQKAPRAYEERLRRYFQSVD